MACLSPLKGRRSAKRSKTGKYPVIIDNLDHGEATITVPCGQCIGCRLDYSKSWAIRCVHESRLYEQNSFITLTYDNEHLPLGGGLCKRDFQLFMKSLRKAIAPKKVRYYHCGEYGDRYGRPHYHALLFGLEFPDLELHSQRNGQPVYTSELLDSTWKRGISVIGNVTFESAAYVARYCLKKRSGKGSFLHYLNKETGEILQPEYATMSRRPGIGANFYKQFRDDMYPQDLVVHEGRKMKPPRYYDSLYEVDAPDKFEDLKKRRKEQNKKREKDQTPERLEARRVCTEARLKLLPRVVE